MKKLIRLISKKALVGVISLLVIGVPLLYLTLLNSPTTQAAWFNDNWGYRKSIAITNNTSLENNVYIALTLDTATLISAGQLQSDCGDLRYTQQDGNILQFYISNCNNASSSIHVFFPTFPAGAQTIYYYYGNPSAGNGFSAADFSTEASNYTIGSTGNEEKSPGPVVYLKFDKGTGTNAQDSTQQNNDGSISGATWQTEDQCVAGKCLLFDGTDDYVEIPSSSSIPTGGSARTVSMWVRTTNNSWVEDDNSIFEYGDGNTREAFGIDMHTYPYIQIYTWDDDTLVDTGLPATSGLFFITVTYDGDTTLKTYINGALRDTTTLGGVLDTGATVVNIGKSALVNGYFDGFIDEHKIYNYARTADQIKSDYNSRGSVKGSSTNLSDDFQNNPALSDGLVGYWKMDESSGNLTDSSGNGYTGTVTGTTVVAGEFGNGRRFNGSSDLVNIGSQTNLNFSSSTAWTTSLWIKPATQICGAYCRVISRGSDTFEIELNGVGVLDFYSPSTNRVTLFTPTVDVWVHLTFVATGKTIYVYRNGVQIYSAAWSGSNTGALYFGRRASGGEFSAVSMDEVRIYNRALSSTDVTALYNFAPRPVGYWNFDENTGSSANDTSGNGNTGTWNGTLGSQWKPGKYGSGGNFNGSNNFVDFGTSAIFDNGTNPFTWQIWMKMNTISTAAEQHLMDIEDTGGGDDRILFWIPGTGQAETGQIKFQYENGGTATRAISTSRVDDGKWHHISGVFNGTTMYLYIDGVQNATATPTPGTLDFSANLRIGARSQSASNYYNGMADQAMIYNYARTSQQIVSDMNAGHPAVGSPVGSAIGHWKFNEGVDNTCSGGTNDACNSGSQGSALDGANSGFASPATSTSGWTQSGKFGKALIFDGTDDIATITNTGAIDFDTGLINFTFSSWVYADSDGENDVGQIYQKGTNTYLRVDSQSGSNLDIEANLDLATTDANVNVSSAITTGTWNHVAATWNGTTLTVYVNGINKGTDTGSGAISSDANNLLIGGTTTANFDGTIDSFTVYNYALTADQVKIDLNQGQAQVLGTLSDKSTYQPQAANQEYCIPGDSTSCAAPVGQWDFEEGTGSTVNDRSGNANTGTWAGTLGSQWAPGKIGKAGNFNGSTNYVRDTSAFSSSLGSNYTIEMWVKTTASASQSLFSLNRNSNNITNEGILLMNSTGTITFWDYNGSAFGFDTTQHSTNTINNGTWHHIAFTKAGTTGKYYIDGIHDSQPTAANNVTLGTADLVFGADYRDSDEFFNGQIDHVRIYNYTRTPAQIAWDYNRGTPVAQWKFDECQGSVANDASGNLNTGTITPGASGTYTSVGTCAASSASTMWYNGRNGKYNSSLAFDGTDDYVSMNTPISTSIPAVSISFWFKFASYASNANLVFNVMGGGNLYPRIYYTQSTNSLGLQYRIDGSTKPEVTVSSASSKYPTGTWHHYVAVIDAAVGQSVYIDGIKVASDTQTGSTVTGSSAQTMRIGNDTNVNTFMNGQIDEVQVYNYPLTATQAKTLFNQGSSTRFGPLTGQP